MTTEEKAQAYDEVVNKLRHFITQGVDPLITRADVQDFFPELKESEDERIRKGIIRNLEYLEDRAEGFVKDELKKRIAWLEKQGSQKLANSAKTCKDEQKSADNVEPKFKVGDYIKHNKANIICKVISVNSGSYYVENIETNGRIELFNAEQNFHLWTTQDAKDGDVLATLAGAFIYNGNNGGGSCPGSYCGINTSGRFQIGVEHHWTGKKIHPATKEERDLLFLKMHEAGYEWDAEKKELKKINSYCQENCKVQETGKCFADGECKAKREAEQEPTDEEMKTLLRTEYEKGRADAIAEIQNPVDCIDCTNSKGCINCEDGNMKETLVQKTAWSEEDEETLRWLCTFLNIYGHEFYEGNEENVIDWLKSFKSRIQLQQEWSEEDETTINNLVWAISNDCIRPQDREDYCDWLKSLKDRYSWKPSDKQREALEHFVRSIGESGYASPYDNNTKLLYSLLSDLKKLKGES